MLLKFGKHKVYADVTISETVRVCEVAAIREYKKDKEYSAFEIEAAASQLLRNYDENLSLLYVHSVNITLYDVNDSIVYLLGEAKKRDGSVGDESTVFVQMYYKYERGADDENPIIILHEYARRNRG